jgi:hypothetical protein
VKLRQAKVEMGRGLKVPEVCRKLSTLEQAFYLSLVKTPSIYGSLRSRRGDQKQAETHTLTARKRGSGQLASRCD